MKKNEGCVGIVIVWLLLLISLPCIYFSFVGNSTSSVVVCASISIICVIIIIINYVIKRNEKEQNVVPQRPVVSLQNEDNHVTFIHNYFETNITKDFFYKTNKTISSLTEFLDYLLGSNFYEWLDRQQLPQAEGVNSKQLANQMILSDIKTATLAMDSIIDLKTQEGFVIFMITYVTIYNENVEYGMLKLINDDTLEPILNSIDNSYNLFNKEGDKNKLVFADILSNYDIDVKLQYFIVLYRVLSMLAKVNGSVTERGEDYLSKLLLRAKAIDNKANIKEDVVATLNVLKEFGDELRVGQYVIREQKCVISDIQVGLGISRMRILKALKTLERVGVVQTEGNKRNVLITREGDVIRLLRDDKNSLTNINDDVLKTDTPFSPFVKRDIINDSIDPLFLEIAKFVVLEQEGKISVIQRHFEIGYNRAGKIADKLESMGIYGPNRGANGREVLVKDIKQLEELLSRDNR